MKKKFVKLWSIYNLDNEDRIELIKRTSNNLERHNRLMKYNVFWSMHPNLVIFSDGLEGGNAKLK